jgi:hypothetical protein
MSGFSRTAGFAETGSRYNYSSFFAADNWIMWGVLFLLVCVPVVIIYGPTFMDCEYQKDRRHHHWPPYGDNSKSSNDAPQVMDMKIGMHPSQGQPPRTLIPVPPDGVNPNNYGHERSSYIRN